MTTTLAFSNQKGGVAKTTSCLSIGSSLVELNKRVLLIDMDPQAHLSMGSGVAGNDLEWSLTDLLADEVSPALDDVIQSTSLENLWIMPADIGLASREHKLFGQPGYEHRLVELLKPIRVNFDYFLIDCPPSLGPLTLMALTAADLTLIPAQCDYYAFQGVLRLLEVIEAVQARTNPALDFLLFVTLFDPRPLISRKVLAQLHTHFGKHLLETTIRTDARLRESSLVGEPITQFAPRSRGAALYRSLTNELVNILEN